MGTKVSVNKLMNEWMTEVFVEQPLALPGSANYEQTKQNKQEGCYSKIKDKNGSVINLSSIVFIILFIKNFL